VPEAFFEAVAIMASFGAAGPAKPAVIAVDALSIFTLDVTRISEDTGT